MNRTEFLINNPRMIDALALKVGLPFRELEDFRQEVILKSLQEADDFDPSKAKLSTYTSNYIKNRAVDYTRRLKRFPGQLLEPEYVPDDGEPT